MIASVTKSIVATQLGELQATGRLDLDDPVVDYLGSGWTNASRRAEAEITIRHLATMTSGLDEDFNRVAPPGTVWFYNTPAYRESIDVIEAASELSRSAYADAVLWTPIGMHDTQYMAPNNELMISTARDIARFGLLIARNGVWDGHRVLNDPSILREARRPSQELNPAYGLLWWVNGQSAWTFPNGSSGQGSLVQSAPDDMTMALGAGDQKVYIVPSMDLIVTRVGQFGSASPGVFDELLWAQISAAAP